MAPRKAKVPGDAKEIVARLESMTNPANVAGMRRFGITPSTRLLGVSVTALRKIAHEYEPNHSLALDLWNSGIHDVRILASMLDIPDAVTLEQMDTWANDFDSWDICDQTCANLFRYTPFVERKAYEWVESPREFVKRAGFVIMAVATVNRAVSNDALVEFLPTLVNGMTDERNFVKKAVSWTFRQIGKRDYVLRNAVLDAVEPLVDSTDKTTRWIAKDVVKELRG